MPLAHTILFLAALAQVLLTCVQYSRLLKARMAEAKSGDLDVGRVAYDSSAWPLKPRLIANSVSSQFELPVLFYVAVALAFTLGAANWITAALAWIFVVTRIVHAVIHTGSNEIMPRLRAFLAGFVAVLLMWVYLLFHVLQGSLIGA